jgi:hypothetical protein
MKTDKDGRVQIMRRIRIRPWLMAALAVFAVGWPLAQWVSAVQDRNDPYEPVYLLYQVSLFQLELLHNQLEQAAHAGRTEGLDLLRMTAYSVHYTHERLRLAASPRGELVPLASVEEMLQYILRLQVGGSRELNAGETGVFAEASGRFRSLYEAYQTLIGSKGRVIASQNRELERHDRELYELFHQKLLE